MSRPVNKAEILRQSRTLDRVAMANFCYREYGVRVSQFEALMREVLPKEQDYQTRIIEAIREAYPSAFVWKATAGPYARQGIPDICAIVDGKFYGIEVKRPYIGKTSVMQLKTIADIKEAGGKAAVISFPEQALGIVRGVIGV